MSFISLVYDFLKSGLATLGDIDWSQIKYPRQDLAIGIFIFLLTLVGLKALLSRNRFSERYSGYFISKSYGQGISSKSVRFISKVAISFGVVLLLIAISDPLIFVTKTKTTFYESRERVELLDVSASMSWEFGNSKKSLAEIVRDSHIKFLEMRKNKNDRIALWVFAQKAYKIEDFTVDSELYENQVADAPYTLIDPGHWILPENDPLNLRLDPVLLREKISIMQGEGGTDLSYALSSVIRYFDENGNKSIKRKAVLIITDAVVLAYPENELKELQKRKIIPYVVYIKANEEGPRDEPDFKERLANGEKLKNQVSNYGGKYFDISNQNNLARAYEEIDRLETVKSKSVNTVNKIFLFQTFILFGVLVIFIALAFLMVLELFAIYP